jgi:mono/diheme cytochrome c family protein
MKMNAAFLRFVIAGTLTVSFSTTALAQDAKPAGDPAKGQKLMLTAACYMCHGTFGQGGGGNGPRLAPNPIPVASFLRQLRRPAGRMPVYTPSVLSDAQAGDVYAYLQSIKPGKAAKDIPMLNLR